jgi:thiosulfate/3-mercaptopyruvate sulfurtransferase
MRILRVLPLFVFAAALLSAPAEQMLVSTSWLAERLSDPQVVVLHVGTPKDYDEGHIPGARLVRLEDITITDERGLRTQLPRVEALLETFGKLGVTDESRVVVYSANAEIQSATRVWFTLDYLGLSDRISMLDGGLALWQKEARPLSKEAVPAASGGFTARPAPVRVASAEWIRMHLKDPAVLPVDARTPQYYSGADKGMMVRGGRIPGAISVPYSSFFADDGRLKAPEELRRLLKAGTTAQEPVRVTYCHVGRQATVPYFVGRYLGLDVRVFDGSFQEWSQRTEFPVESDSPNGK